jgi:hypothetical protein
MTSNNNIIKCQNIEQVNFNYFGKKLINTSLEQPEKGLNNNILPFYFLYNSNWKINHVCPNCSNNVEIFENFENFTKNYTMLSMVSSKLYSENFIKNLDSVFNKIKIVEIDGVLYLNYIDFEYTLDMQRKSSISLTYYKCENCDLYFLGLYGFAYPLEPDKGNNFGELGSVSIREIISIKSEKPFSEILEDEKKGLIQKR